jgi:hypothetical protein
MDVNRMLFLLILGTTNTYSHTYGTWLPIGYSALIRTSDG